MRSKAATGLLVAALTGLSCGTIVAGDEADTAIARGRLIYEKGESASGPIDAALNDGQLVLPASMLTCSGCHGIDGRGGSEGGVDVSDVRWSALSRPLSSAGGMSRTRSAYDRDGLKRAIAMGFDVDGNPLHRAMPRYRLSTEEADDLVAYLSSLDSRDPVGVKGDRLVVATLEPPDSRASLGGYQQRLTASIDRLNEQGGIYGRTVELVTIPAGRVGATGGSISSGTPWSSSSRWSC